MAGSPAGGLKAAKTNRKKYGRDFYQRIGAEGGKVSSTGGFHQMSREDPASHREHSATGGRRSRRGSSKEN